MDAEKLSVWFWHGRRRKGFPFRTWKDIPNAELWFYAKPLKKFPQRL
jgi:hypothetical protein